MVGSNNQLICGRKEAGNVDNDCSKCSKVYIVAFVKKLGPLKFHIYLIR